MALDDTVAMRRTRHDWQLAVRCPPLPLQRLCAGSDQLITGEVLRSAVSDNYRTLPITRSSPTRPSGSGALWLLNIRIHDGGSGVDKSKCWFTDLLDKRDFIPKLDRQESSGWRTIWKFSLGLISNIFRIFVLIQFSLASKWSNIFQVCCVSFLR